MPENAVGLYDLWCSECTWRYRKRPTSGIGILLFLSNHGCMQRWIAQKWGMRQCVMVMAHSRLLIGVSHMFSWYST